MPVRCHTGLLAHRSILINYHHVLGAELRPPNSCTEALPPSTSDVTEFGDRAFEEMYYYI